MSLKNSEIVTGPMLSAYSSLKCEKPFFVTTRSGKRIPVPCGRCISCLRKRRNSWAVRLDDESKNPLCVDQFGITLTYDTNSLPWLPACVLHNKTYEYVEVSKNKWLLKVNRGVSPAQLRNRTAVSLAYSYDIECYIKRLRKWLDDNASDFFLRYYIVSDYGELEGKRTGRAHYHGIIFLFAKSLSIAETLRRSSSRFSFADKIRNVAMDKWPYAQRIYNQKKHIFIGKDYHQIDKGYTSYLGKYLNKYEDTEAIGRRYVDTRIFCSRSSKKYGLGPIGYNSLIENNNQDYKRFFVELDRCVKNNERFRPYILDKPLNGCYRKKLLEEYFGFKFSRLAKYIEMKNYYQLILDNVRIERTEELDPNDPLEVLYKSTATLVYPHIYKRINPFRKRASIIRPPLYSDYDTKVDFELPNRPFTPSEICAFCRYIDFCNKQLDLYLRNFKGCGKYIISNYKIYRYLSGYHYTHKETYIKALYARQNVLNEIETLKKFAETYARYHEKVNKYTDY